MNKVLLNNIPITDYDVYLADGSYKSLIGISTFKTIEFNDWAEYDYIEPDLHNPVLDKRVISLNFFAYNKYGYESFIRRLCQQVYNTFVFQDLNYTVPLRYFKSTFKETNEKIQTFTVDFYEDTQHFFTLDTNIVGAADVVAYVSVDHKDIGEYGISVLDGSYKSVRQMSEIKQRLTINEKSFEGQYYDYIGNLHSKEFDFTLKLLIRAQTLAQTLKNYHIFFSQLTKKYGRLFIFDDLNVGYDCYYKSMNVHSIHSDLSSGYCGIEFDLTMAVYGDGIVKVLANDTLTKALTDEDNKCLTE